MNRTGLSHYAWNPLCVCKCDKSICYDVPCLDRQLDRSAMARVVRTPFALTRLRPEGKCSDMAVSRRIMTSHGCVQKENALTWLRSEGKCPDTLRPVSRCHGKLHPDARRPGIRCPNAWCHGVLRPDARRPGIRCPNARCHGVLRPDPRRPGIRGPNARSHGVLRSNSYCLCVSRWERYVPCQGASRASQAPGASGRSLCVRMQIFFPDDFFHVVFLALLDIILFPEYFQGIQQGSVLTGSVGLK